MSFIGEDGNIVFSRSGVPKFNSAERNQLVTDFVNTSFAIPGKGSGGGFVNSTIDIELATVSPFANLVLGQVFDGTNVFSIGGTSVDFTRRENMPSSNVYQSSTTSGGTTLTSASVHYHFFFEASKLKVRLFRKFPGNSPAYTGKTILVRAFCLTFDY